MPRSFFVPDLSPQAHPENFPKDIRAIFVGESPHKSEVEPESESERRPLCGKAGQAWWSMVSEIFESAPSADVSLSRLLSICSKNRLAVINAVQYPMDLAITKHFPEGDPLRVLGFAKTTGEKSYKKESKQVLKAIGSLRLRLKQKSVAHAPIYSLGGDSEWFVSRALGEEEFKKRFAGKIPHPSCWWRNAKFKKTAREALLQIKNEKRAGP